MPLRYAASMFDVDAGLGSSLLNTCTAGFGVLQLNQRDALPIEPRYMVVAQAILLQRKRRAFFQRNIGVHNRLRRRQRVIAHRFQLSGLPGISFAHRLKSAILSAASV